MDIYNRRNSIQCIGRESDDYPGKLKLFRGMPKALWVVGSLPDPDRPAVAVVGARRCTPFGRETARHFARELARSGVQILSGLAWGIDAAAHSGALEGEGDTFAVLGCGADVCYPSGNRGLYDRIAGRRGSGILSEQSPGSPPLPGYFPARNRIISALSDLVLVVEARERSGSLITADFALEQGRDVFAVPGRVTDELSRGCLNLIRQGAGVADCPESVLEALGISRKLDPPGNNIKKISLANEENIVYSWLRLQPVSLEELVKKTGFPVSRVLPALMALELKGLIREVRKNDYVRTDLRVTDGEIFSDRGVACEGEDN